VTVRDFSALATCYAEPSGRVRPKADYKAGKIFAFEQAVLVKRPYVPEDVDIFVYGFEAVSIRHPAFGQEYRIGT